MACISRSDLHDGERTRARIQEGIDAVEPRRAPGTFETRSLLKFTRSHLRCFAETSQLEREKMLAVEVLRL